METMAASQCCVVNVFTAMSLPLIHLAMHAVPHNNTPIKNTCNAAMMIMLIYYGFISGISKITFMHQLVGMMSWEAGARSIDGVVITITTRTELLVMLAFFVPNLLVVLGETSFGFTDDGGFHVHGLEHFAHTTFFRKQHAFLHGVLCIYILSICSSWLRSWRHCPKVQRARTFLEPMCLFSVAMILITHTHGAEDPDHLPSHPAVGTLAIVMALAQMCTNILHLSYPSEGSGDRLEVDLSVKGGSAPVLKMCRLANAFVCMTLAYFLYIDSIMEYMGCRQDVLLVGPPGEGARQGLTAQTELTTYVAGAIMMAALSIVGFALLERPIRSKDVPELELAEMEPVMSQKA